MAGLSNAVFEDTSGIIEGLRGCRSPKELEYTRQAAIASDATKRAAHETATAGIREQVKVMTGGAPVTQDFVEKIGTDAYGANAAPASERAKSLLA